MAKKFRVGIRNAKTYANKTGSVQTTADVAMINETLLGISILQEPVATFLKENAKRKWASKEEFKEALLEYIDGQFESNGYGKWGESKNTGKKINLVDTGALRADIEVWEVDE